MNWLEKYKEKEHKKDLKRRKEACVHNLLEGIETEESLEMFLEVKGLVFAAIQKRLERITEEKSNIENFKKSTYGKKV